MPNPNDTWEELKRKVKELIGVGAPAQQSPTNQGNPQEAWQKASTIGPPKAGEHYVDTEAPQGLEQIIRKLLVGNDRPYQSAAQDPYGIIGMEHGGQVPAVFGTESPFHLPSGLSKAAFATTLHKNPTLAQALTNERRVAPSPLAGVSEQRASEIASGSHPNPPVPRDVSDTRYNELLNKFGITKPPEQKMTSLGQSSVSNDVSAVPVHPMMVDQLVKKTAEGGTTFNLTNGDLSGQPLYSVGAHPDRTLSLKTPPTAADINGYIQKNMDLLKNPEESFGSWHDPTKGDYVLDVVKTLPSQSDAIKLGIKMGQDDIYGLEKGDLIPVPQSNKSPSLLGNEKGVLNFDLEPFVKLLKMGKGGPEFTANVIRRMEKAVRAGEGTAGNWDPLKNYKEAFGKDAADTEMGPKMFGRFWGATSPNTTVGRNNYESLQAWKAFIEGKGPFTPELARQLDITNTSAKVPNLNRATRSEPLQGGRGERGKTEAMSRLATGDPNTTEFPTTPIDVHALSGVGAGEPDVSRVYPDLRKFITEKTGNRPSTYTELYNIAADIYRKGLSKFGEDLFPQMWEGVKLLKGQGQSEGMTSWLKSKGLLAPGQMVDPKALEAVIQSVDRSSFYGKGPSKSILDLKPRP